MTQDNKTPKYRHSASRSRVLVLPASETAIKQAIAVRAASQTFNRTTQACQRSVHLGYIFSYSSSPLCHSINIYLLAHIALVACDLSFLPSSQVLGYPSTAATNELYLLRLITRMRYGDLQQL